jgi:hypothetical protein
VGFQWLAATNSNFDGIDSKIVRQVRPGLRDVIDVKFTLNQYVMSGLVACSG